MIVVRFSCLLFRNRDSDIRWVRITHNQEPGPEGPCALLLLLPLQADVVTGTTHYYAQGTLYMCSSSRTGAQDSFRRPG